MSSNLTRHEVFYWFTTPHELRELADEMERFWTTCQPGQDKTVRRIYGRGETLHILVDQEHIKSPGWYETRKKQEARDAR